MGPAHPAGGASVSYLENIRAIVQRLAEEAGIHDPASFAHSWHLLMKGSIVAEAEGDVDAAQRPSRWRDRFSIGTGDSGCEWRRRYRPLRRPSVCPLCCPGTRGVGGIK
jgi:hypothetical protein